MEKHIFKKEGGSWLGAVRNWIQWNCLNGDSVTWGSNDDLGHFTVNKLEDVAGEAAYATEKPFHDIERGIKRMFNLQIAKDENVTKAIKEMNEEIKKLSEFYGVDLSQ